ncbi:MAG: aminotransferase class III-fold pyridoxal phosphate-dependent enzyme [Acidiferrobacterales bacterium]|nr:aminotransferase class III-fold pyridoxal phosphate-dependent enzyme [Acidiferrobacterales bacterium]
MRLEMDNLWMPFTSNRDFKADPRLISHAKGVYLYTPEGRQIIDASSGLFCCAAGHSRDEIATAVYRQLNELAYSAPFQLGHEHSFELARRLAELTPEGMDRVFFVNSGSESIDTAIKIALAYHYARGEAQRQRLISRERAYHGVNIGGTALSGMVKNRQGFGLTMPGIAHMRHTWLAENRFERNQPQNGAYLADDLQRLVDNYGADTIAACFVEPVAGSTGCLVPPQGYLERLREICDNNGILLVFDEVICGFGRTGEPFGAQSFGVTPDLMTLAKALTNAALPMGAIVVGRHVYDTIVDAAPDKAIELFHGYTYSGHPAACVAGLATLDIYRDENLFECGRQLSGYFQDSVFALQEHDVVTDVRGFGMMAGIDVRQDGAPGNAGLTIQKQLFHSGLHVKATGDALIVAPPLVSTRAHIDEICEKFAGVFKAC